MRGVYLAAALTLALCAGVAVGGVLASGWHVPIGDKVAVIHLSGYMTTQSAPTGYGLASSETIARQIRSAAADAGTRAIVLRLDSGGGSPAAAEEIRAEVMRARKTKPVVASMGSVAASAAYYVASSCDYIVCLNSTMTGGVGVAWVFEDRSRYYDDEGISFFIAKNGTLKDMGTDTRPLTEQEKQYAQQVVDTLFDHFLSDIRAERNLSNATVSYISDSRVLTGRQAVQLGLADGTGDLYDAVQKAAELAGISHYHVVSEGKPSITGVLFGSETNSTVRRYHVGVGRVVSVH
ncbi:MAG: signal peptide peptidase SppA [Methermicoccaceae archaeon]